MSFVPTHCLLAAALLIKAVSHWYQEHGPKMPANAKEKAAFRELLKSWQHSIDGIPVEVSQMTGILILHLFYYSSAIGLRDHHARFSEIAAYYAGAEFRGSRRKCQETILASIHT